MGLFGDLLSEVAKTAVAAAAEGAAAGVAEGLSNRTEWSNSEQESNRCDMMDYTPTYVEYVEMLNAVIEGRLEKFNLDFEIREKLFRIGLLAAYALYCDGFEEGGEIELDCDHWKMYSAEIPSFSVEIGVRYKENWRELIQIREMVCEGMCIIYKRMRDDIENKDSKTWAGQLKLLLFSFGSIIGDGKVSDFRHAFATLICELIRKDDIVMRTLTSEAVKGVEIREWL